MIQTSKKEDITHTGSVWERGQQQHELIYRVSALQWIAILCVCVCKCKTIYLLLFRFVLFLHCCLCISPSLFLFFPCSSYGVFNTSGSLQDMVTKYQKRKNKTWEWKMHPLFLSLWLSSSFFVFFSSPNFQPRERIMQYSISCLFALSTKTLWGEVILSRMESCVCGKHLR